jgi:hypothetical protein
MADTTALEIHPAIGIARMGSSQEFFVGPEPGAPIPTDRRDTTPDKLLKRQAARFRVYSCVRDPLGTLVSFEELTPAKATITWTVHLVNCKAAGPAFLKGGVPNTDRTFRRNGATGNPTADNSLIIDGGSKTLTGSSQPKTPVSGSFKGHDVQIGEISTDADGRLVVVGGFGVSRSFPTTPISNFADNNNWHDDTSDGPVEATVHFLDGRPDQAVDKPAWVICCQPDFAPGIGNIVTLYDAFVDRGIARNLLPLPTFRPAYDRDIFPLLKRALMYQWVNQFNHDAHSPGAVADFSDPSLGDPAKPNGPRAAIVKHLSDPNHPTAGPISAAKKPMPALFSDDYFTDKTLPLLLTRSQYRILNAWATGAFDAVATTRAPTPAVDDPDELTRFVLDQCVGASFCPGIEAGRRIRDDIYDGRELFRFDRSKLDPGGLTESMALPWQADFIDCSWEASSGLGLGRGWWPAQRPDQVFSSLGASTMDDWLRGITDVADFIANWSKLGVVLDKGSPGAPFFVEDQRVLP